MTGTPREIRGRELRDLTESVIGDLRWLIRTNLTSADEQQLREVSARLRRLLIDGTLQRYRRTIGLKGEARVTVTFSDRTDDDTWLSQRDVVTRGGISIGEFRVYNRELSDGESAANYARWKATFRERQTPLSTWMSGTCLRVAGVAVTRRDVVKFVANKLGGVHLDHTRDPRKTPGYLALDQARVARVQVLDLDPVFGSLTGIAQALIASADVAALIDSSG